MESAILTRSDPACRKTLARLRLRRWQMRKAGIRRITDGAMLTPAAQTDVRVTWMRHGWQHTGEGMGARTRP
jgi:hypothetical protein